MENWLGDTNTTFNCHHATKQEWTQAKEDHAQAKNAAENVRLINAYPVPVGRVHEHRYGPIDEVAEKVRDHQATGEEQKRRLGLFPESLIRLHQDCSCQAVGCYADCHKDEREDN